MQIRQLVTPEPSPADLAPLAALGPQLVLVFAAIEQCRSGRLFEAVRAAFPGAAIAGCSTAGEISGEGVGNGTTVITAVSFAHTRVAEAHVVVSDLADSFAAGVRLGAALPPDGLRHALVFGPGIAVNGSALIDGLRSAVPAGCTLSGGLAGDAGRFEQTFTVSRDGADPRGVVAVGLYGDRVVLGNASFHGWAPFGPARKVTRADGNLLLELDGEPALEVYKRYLGPYAKDLPASGLLFPFELVGAAGRRGLLRTILGIDEARGSLLLAGDVAQDSYVRLMHATTDSLVDGAQTAAEHAGEGLDGIVGDRLAVLVSCVGRKLVMGARVDEEVEAVTDVLGRGCALAGYYSYGEFSPLLESQDCRLHNQTMTITHLAEVA